MLKTTVVAMLTLIMAAAISAVYSSPYPGSLSTDEHLRFRRTPTHSSHGDDITHFSSLSHKPSGHQSRTFQSYSKDKELANAEGDLLVPAAQTLHGQRSPRLGYSGTVVDGKSSHILGYNRGVPVYGAGEPYYFSYTHNFPIAVNDFESQVNSHNLPKKYKFGGGLDVTGLLE